MKALLVGLGSIGKRHVAALFSIHPDCRIFALRSQPDSEAYPGVTNITSLTELPDEGVDFAIVANPTALHAETIELLEDIVHDSDDAGDPPLLAAIADGTFGLMKRPPGGGKGLDGVALKADEYYNPAVDLMEGE